MITIYKTEHCPMCKLLTQKLEEKHIPFNVVSEINILKQKNILQVPMLEINNSLLNFQEALKWVGEYQ